MRKLVLFIISVVTVLCYANDRIIVVDADDKSPVSGAAVFSQSGIIIGLTSDGGTINISNTADYPVTVKCLGYDPITVGISKDTIKLKHTTYELNEVVVTAAERPVNRVMCYIREFISGSTTTDTLMYFNEHMADFLLVDKKVKGFKSMDSPRILTTRSYARISDSDGLDSVFCPKYRNDMFAWEQLVKMPSGYVKFTDRIKDGAVSDTIAGKYGTKEVIREQAPVFYISKDLLADSKDHTMSPLAFKLLGLSLDINELQSSWIINPTSRNGYSASEIVLGTFSMKIIGRGKWIKKAFKTDQPVEMFVYYEIYPVETERLTVEEAKELKKNAPASQITVSPNVIPLSPSIQRMVDAINK